MRRQPTESARATVSQEFRFLVLPEPGVDPSACRKITILTPSSPIVNFAITPYTLRSLEGNETTVIKSPRDIGLNQPYKTPTLPVVSVVFFELLAEQGIIASASEGNAFLSMIIEYI